MANMVRFRAIVLKRINYAEVDRIIKFMTPSGEISALAKGVRKQGSKLAGGIEPFCLIDIVVVRGKSDLYRLTSAKLVEYYDNIIKDFARMEFGYKIIKLITKNHSGIKDDSWFNLLKQCLENLNKPTVDMRLIEAWFYLHLADLLGESLNLVKDESGQAITADEVYFYDSNSKGLIKSEQGNLIADHIKMLRLLSSKSLNLITKISGVDEILDDVLLVAKAHCSVE